MRLARSALLNLIRTTTGSATAITLIYPELAGRLNGHAVRVPILNGSLTDCVFEIARPNRPDDCGGDVSPSPPPAPPARRASP